MHILLLFEYFANPHFCNQIESFQKTRNLHTPTNMEEENNEGILNGNDDEVQDKKSKKVAKHDGGVADLERVTDYAEEKELSSADISNVT